MSNILCDKISVLGNFSLDLLPQCVYDRGKGSEPMLKERLPVLRRSKGWTMKHMAEELHIPYTTYVGYEKGVR